MNNTRDYTRVSDSRQCGLTITSAITATAELHLNIGYGLIDSDISLIPTTPTFTKFGLAAGRSLGLILYRVEFWLFLRALGTTYYPACEAVFFSKFLELVFRLQCEKPG